MDNSLVIYGSAIAMAGFAARLVPGVASWAIPVSIGVLANSPDAQARVATNWKDSAQELQKAFTGLQTVKKSGAPQEWDAGDRTAFENSVNDLINQITKAKDVVHSAGQTMQHTSTASRVCAYFCLTAAGLMLYAAYTASAAATAGPAGMLGGQLAARGVAAKVLSVVNGVLEKQRSVYLTAAGIVIAGAGWHVLQRQILMGQLNAPEGDKPDFNQVRKWGPEV